MRKHWPALLAVVAMSLSACGGSDAATGPSGGEQAASTGAGSGTNADALAALGIIAKDTAVRPTSGGEFRDGADGETLRQGDTVRTSATGFAELAYFDGSFTRIDNAAELTLTKLEKTDARRNVNTTLASGRSWNRVAKATSATDTYTVDTPVANAAVRGTAFLIDCTPTDRCTFTVVEGTIVLTIPGRDPLVLTAPAQVDVARDPSRTVTSRTVTLDQLLADPFTARNLQIDITKKFPAITGGTSTTTSGATTTTGAAPTTTTLVGPPVTRSPATTQPPTATEPPTTEPPTTAPPTTVPPTTTPPTTVPPLSLDLAGTWTNTLISGTLIASVGCGAGSTVAITGNALTLVAPAGGDCPVPNTSPFSFPTTRVLTCTGVVCANGETTWTRISPTAIAYRIAQPLAECPQVGPENFSAELSEDGRTLTNRGWVCWYWTSTSGAPAGATFSVTLRMTR